MTGLILLAAGESSRLGQPKQKIVFEGKTLLQRAINVAVDTPCNPILVILGAYAKELQLNTSNERIVIVDNKNWQEGMASSIRTGMSTLQQTEVDEVIITVSDQPFVNSQLLNKLIETKKSTRKELIACSYSDTLGVPALFSKKYFEELLLLTGPDGAKKLLINHADSIASIDFPLGNIDIDTTADLDALNKFSR